MFGNLPEMPGFVLVSLTGFLLAVSRRGNMLDTLGNVEEAALDSSHR